MTIQHPVSPPTGAEIPAELLLHPAVEQALATIGVFYKKLAKLSASMDVLIDAKGEKVRPALEALAEHLIGFLDATGPDSDLEEDDEGDNADDEPLLGASETMNQSRTWRHPLGPEDEGEDLEGDELDAAEIGDLDYHGEGDGDNGGCVDDEPSLGSLDGRMSQKRWGQPDRDVLWPNTDLEHDEADPLLSGPDLDKRETNSVSRD